MNKSVENLQSAAEEVYAGMSTDQKDSVLARAPVVLDSIAQVRLIRSKPLDTVLLAVTVYIEVPASQ